jgi:hypothetical protein
MDYRTLGNSGCVVLTLALGTMTFGAEANEAESHAQLDRFVEAGGTLIDTADVYSAGVSEEIIGRWLDDRPADLTEPVVLATKGRFPMAADPNGVGLSARHLTRALEASLTRLGVDAIDLYQAHAFDPHTPLEETLRTFDGFIRAGKIRYYGFELHGLAAHQGRGVGRSNGRSCRPPSMPASACCRGHRWAVGGCPASTGATNDRPAPPGSARILVGAWRPTTNATSRLAPGTSSMQCSRLPTRGASRWRRSRSRG